MSNYKLCPSCKDVKTDKHHQLYSVVNMDCTKSGDTIPLFDKQTSGGEKVHIILGKQHANCLIYYFASQKKSENGFVPQEKSYQNASNNGLKKLDMNGEAIITLDCPQHYQEGGKSYMSHVHILVSDKNMTSWKKKLISINVLCDVSKKILKQHIKNNDRLIINALPSEYHEKASIPSSFNLVYKDSKKMSVNEIQKKVKAMVKEHTKFNRYITKHKISFMDIPLCVYCYDRGCSAGHQLANDLYRAGFTNVIDYKSGISGWK